MTNSSVRKTELARVLYLNGFDIEKTKFRKFGKKGIHFKTKCKHGYILLDENEKELENICNSVRIAMTYHLSSRKQYIPVDFNNVCIESIIEESDVEPGEPYCKSCSRYFANYIPAVKERIMERVYKLHDKGS